VEDDVDAVLSVEGSSMFTVQMGLTGVGEGGGVRGWSRATVHLQRGRLEEGGAMPGTVMMQVLKQLTNTLVLVVQSPNQDAVRKLQHRASKCF
jgi:hypothetical protein